MKRRNFKRGVSMMEVVIAIFIISLVTAVSATLIVSAVKNEEQTLRTTQIAVICDNAIDCFNVASNDEEFISLLQKTDSFVKDEQSFKLEKSNFTVLLFTDFSQDKLSILCTDNGGNTIYSNNYVKLS